MAKKHQTYQSQYTSSVNITNDIMPIIDNPHLHINITHSNTIKPTQTHSHFLHTNMCTHTHTNTQIDNCTNTQNN